MRPPHRPVAASALAWALAISACGSSSGRITAVDAATLARWTPAVHISRVLDLSVPRHDGAVVVATAGRLALLRPGGSLQAFASGPGGYLNPSGEEPYIALSSSSRGRGVRCGYGRDVLYVLRLSKHPGVTGNPHPGDDAVLRIDAAALAAAGVRPGDLLVATEGGAHTVAVTCTSLCSVRHVADGPAVAHLEGHIVFTR
jgi:hypothetical protein